MGSLDRRLSRLEPPNDNGHGAAWSFRERCAHLVSVVRYWVRVEGRAKYPATDRELRDLAVMASVDATDGRPGRYALPSGAAVVVHQGDPDDEDTYEVIGQPVISDLPAQIQRLIGRMPTQLQAEREAELPGLHRASKEATRTRGYIGS